jgi:hypothetical protein
VIGFGDKSELFIAPPTGVGVNAIGGATQYTWLEFINGANQQDSNGGPIGGGGSCPDWDSLSWTAMTITGTPDTSVFNTLNNTISLNLSVTSPNASSMRAAVGSLYHTGGNCNCVARIRNYTKDNARGTTGFLIRQDGVTLLEFRVGDYAAGDHDINFSVIAGVASEITIQEYQVFPGIPGGFEGWANLSGSFDPCFITYDVTIENI